MAEAQPAQLLAALPSDEAKHLEADFEDRFFRDKHRDFVLSLEKVRS